MTMNNSTTKLTLSAMFMAVGMLLPMITGQIPQIGNMLLPMHIPVFLCGLLCGWQYGAVIGFILPLLRSLVFGMPPMFPNAVAMAFELATYGLITGILYYQARCQNIRVLYCSMLTAMVAGRIVWGMAEVILLGIGHNCFTWQAFMTGAFLTAVPGILLQFILIPSIMAALNKTGLVPYKKITLESRLSGGN